MTRTPRWIDRTFRFDQPVEFLPYFVERLRMTAPRLEELTAGVAEEMLRFQPGGAWSVKEHIGHLIDLEELHEGRLDDYREGRTTLRPADITNRKTTEANHNARELSELLGTFRNTREHFIGRIVNLSAEELGRSALHPRLKVSMRVVDLVYFVAEHDVHHVSKVTEILGVPGGLP